MFWKPIIVSYAAWRNRTLPTNHPQHAKYAQIVQEDYVEAWQMEERFINSWKLSRYYTCIEQVQELVNVLCQVIGCSPPKQIKEYTQLIPGWGEYNPLTRTITISDFSLEVILHELAHHISMCSFKNIKDTMRDLMMEGTFHGGSFLIIENHLFNLLRNLQNEALEKLPLHPIMSVQHTATSLLRSELQRRKINQAWQKTKQEIGL